MLHPGDAGAQTRHVLETIQTTLEAAGATMADVAFNHIFLTDWADYAGGERGLCRVFPWREAGALLHPVRAGEAGLPRRDRLRGASRLMPREGRASGTNGMGPRMAAGPILSPGLGGSANYWAPQSRCPRRSLSACCSTIIAARAAAIRPLPDECRVETMAADVVELMQGARHIRSPHFIGHALGGLIGLELALAHDDLAKLVIVNGWAGLDPHTRRCFDLRLELLRKSGPRPM